MYSQILWPELGKWPFPPKWSLPGSVGSSHDSKGPLADHQGGRRPLASSAYPKAKTREKVIDFLLAAASLELLDDARAVFAILRESIYPVNSIHNLYLNNLFEEHKVDYGESLVKEADLALTDLPYNVRGIHQLRHCSHDKFAAGDMKKIVFFCQQGLRLAHVVTFFYCIVFCFLKQFVGKRCRKYERRKYVAFPIETNEQRNEGDRLWFGTVSRH